MDVLTFFKQFSVVFAAQLAGLSIGGAVTYPIVLLKQLSSAESTIQLDLDTSSWIGSIQGLAGIPSILMPALMQWQGRKTAFICACLATAIGWIIAYSASSVASLLISECFHGFGGNSLLTVTLLTISEMVDPSYRNVSMQSFAISQVLGLTLVVTMTERVHWKYVSIIMCAPIVLALLLAITWPESPSWLACKGQFDKCEKAFKWLRGSGSRAQSELTELINAQKEFLVKNRDVRRKTHLIQFFHQLMSRDFYIPVLHMLLLLNLVYWSGGLVIIIFSIDIIQKSTGNESFAYHGGVLIDCILMVGVAISMFLVKRFSNKTILLLSTAADIICLASVSLVTYLQSIGSLPKDSSLSMYFLIGIMVCSSLGLQPIPYDMSAELMPVKYRGTGGVMYVIFMSLLHTSSLKLYPYMVFYIDLWGTFLTYTTNAAVCGFLIWKYVPETKQKTLQQIEDYYTFGEFERQRILGDVVYDYVDTPMIDYNNCDD